MAEELQTPQEPYKQSRNLNKGRVVIARLRERRGADITERPAIVTQVFSPELINAFTMSSSYEEETLRYSLTPAEQTWCWCDEQDLTPAAQSS